MSEKGFSTLDAILPDVHEVDWDATRVWPPSSARADAYEAAWPLFRYNADNTSSETGTSVPINRHKLSDVATCRARGAARCHG